MGDTAELSKWQAELYAWDMGRALKTAEEYYGSEIGPSMGFGMSEGLHASAHGTGQNDCIVTCGSIPGHLASSCYKIIRSNGKTLDRTWLGFFLFSDRDFNFIGGYRCEEFFKAVNRKPIE